MVLSCADVAPAFFLDQTGRVDENAGMSVVVAAKCLSKSTASALGRNAKREGMTVDAYVKKLIAEDIELDRVARIKSFAELARPFQRALAGLSENDLDAIARPRGKKGSAKAKS